MKTIVILMRRADASGEALASLATQEMEAGNGLHARRIWVAGRRRSSTGTRNSHLNLTPSATLPRHQTEIGRQLPARLEASRITLAPGIAVTALHVIETVLTNPSIAGTVNLCFTRSLRRFGGEPKTRWRVRHAVRALGFTKAIACAP
nr:hypothetical protein [Cupriavidus sp. SK-3]